MSGSELGTSRRAVLKTAGGSLGLFTTGVAGAAGDAGLLERCPEATVKPETVHYEHGGPGECSDHHPETKRLKEAVATALQERYPTVGALLDDGYVPYFDYAAADGAEGWSHWLNPEYVGDDAMLDPERPESVLVDHRWWRPIGVMFVATRDGDPVEDPPPVYESDGEACRPWHAHVGLPGRYAWWKYRVLYGEGARLERFRRPCRTPWMLHVWAYPHPDSVYAHGAPPRGNRGGPPAEPAGFDTDANPGEDTLDLSVLGDALSHRARHLLNGDVDLSW